MNNDDEEVVMRQRTSREEVRRRNREIMEKANAEYRDGKGNAPPQMPLKSGKKELSRFPLITQAREGSQTFWVPYEFHSTTPELSFGPLKVDLDVDSAKFSEFNKEHAQQLFGEFLKSTCLIDEGSLAHLDLVNHEEAFAPLSNGIDPLDEPLLTNELTVTLAEAQMAEGVYTGHFLRKPQLMSNDLFTEGNRKVGSLPSNFSIPKGVSEARDAEFDEVKAIDVKAASGEPVFNPIRKANLKIKRVLSVLPDPSMAEVVQFKFDDKNPQVAPYNFVIDKDLCLFENSAMALDGNTDESFPKVYAKKRRYAHANKATTQQGEDFYLLTVPTGNGGVCYLKAAGSKIILKKDATASTPQEEELRLVALDSLV